MPSFSRIKKLSVLGVAVATLGVTASGASAATNDVWVWACHGPNGQELGNVFGSTNFAGYGAGCDAAGDLDAGGLRGQLAVPSGGSAIAWPSTASANLTVPPGTNLTAVRLQRRVTGAVPNVVYSATYSAGGPNTPLESFSGVDVPAEDKTFPVTAVAPGGSLQLRFECTTTGGCPASGPANLDVSSLAMKVSDTSPPHVAVGGYQNPAATKLTLDVSGSDIGTGMRSAWAWVSGANCTPTLCPVYKADFAGTECRDLTPNDATVDMPLGAKCAFGGEHAPPIVVDIAIKNPDGTIGLPNGDGYALNYRVTDWAGNEYNETKPLTLNNNPYLGTNTQTLSIGTTGTTTPNANNNTTGNGGSGGVAGASAQSCRSPRLSFSLSNKPMRISKGVPVLQYGKRYRFNGRLTCVINGKRKSAPKRARVDILNKIGKKTIEKAGTTVRDKGRLTVILSYKSSRTISFRFTNSDGQRSTVSIKVKVEKKKKKKKSSRR
jgi:hypothetical protein